MFESLLIQSTTSTKLHHCKELVDLEVSLVAKTCAYNVRIRPAATVPERGLKPETQLEIFGTPHGRPLAGEIKFAISRTKLITDLV